MGVTDEHGLIFECAEDFDAVGGPYDDFDQQSEMSLLDTVLHRELVRRVGAEFGFPIPKWVRALPTPGRAARR
jgi:hypothetical protein